MAEITAIIGIGNIGRALARSLVGSGRAVILAAGHDSRAAELARELGPLARAASVEDAIADSDVVVLAVWLDTMKDIIAKDRNLFDGKIVIDPSNPLRFDGNGQILRTLPEGETAASVVTALLPAAAHYVKAFGTLAAESFANAANRKPYKAALFYVTDDDAAKTAVERLIRSVGFEPVKAGGVADAGRIEMPGGDLHQASMNGGLLDLDEARAAVVAGVPG